MFIIVELFVVFTTLIRVSLVFPQLCGVSVSLYGVIKGGAGFASEDNPLLVLVISCCMLYLQRCIILSFFCEWRERVQVFAGGLVLLRAAPMIQPLSVG